MRIKNIERGVLIFSSRAHPCKREHSSRKDCTEIPTQIRAFPRQSAGVASDDVPVYYNSGLLSRLGALTYAQETQVEIGIGKKYHPPHKLGNLVQQKLGAVCTNAMYLIRKEIYLWIKKETNLVCRRLVRRCSVLFT